MSVYRRKSRKKFNQDRLDANELRESVDEWRSRMLKLGLSETEINNCLKVQCAEDFHDFLTTIVKRPGKWVSLGTFPLPIDRTIGQASEYLQPSSKPDSDRTPKT